MIPGLEAVVRKELREHREEMFGSGAVVARAGVTLAVFGVFMPSVIGDLLVVPGFLPILGAVVAATTVAARAGDSVAGERDRGTLEMLLTTPLSDHQIVLGKITALVVVGLLGTAASLSSMLPLLAIRYPLDVAAMANGTTVIGTMVPAFFVSGFVAALGLLVSARASNGRDAASRMNMGMMSVVFGPIALAALLPASWTEALATAAASVDSGTAFIGVVVALAALDAGMVALALTRFKRSRILVP